MRHADAAVIRQLGGDTSTTKYVLKSESNAILTQSKATTYKCMRLNQYNKYDCIV